MENLMQDAIVYQLQMRTFTREGTIRRAIDLLPHVASLGVNVVYLTPVTESDDDTNLTFFSDRQKAQGNGNPKNPYRMKDYFKVDPEYGTDADLHDFITRAHELGLKVMLDLVYLHCGPTAPMLRDHMDFCDRDEAGNPLPARWHFPKLNFASQNLREYLWGNMEYYVENFGIDGYRCDVGGEIPLDFWAEGVRRIRAKHPDFMMLNEGVTLDFLTVFDANYDFDWCLTVMRKLAKGELTPAALRAYMTQEPKASRFDRHIHTSETHDSATDDFQNRLEVQAISPRLTDMALVLNMTVPGVPFLFHGQEFADAGRCNMFASRFYPPASGIDWAMLATARGQQRMALVKALCALHTAHPALRHGTVEYPDTELFTMIRRADGETVTVLCNTEAEAKKITAPAGYCVLSDGLDGDALAPHAWAVFVQ